MQKQTNAGFVLKLVCVHPWSICKTQNTFSKATKIKQRASSSATRLMQELFTSALKNLFVESQTYQIGRDLKGNKMCLPSKSLPKLRLIYIPRRMSSLHKSFAFICSERSSRFWALACVYVFNARTRGILYLDFI